MIQKDILSGLGIYISASLTFYLLIFIQSRAVQTSAMLSELYSLVEHK